MYTALALVTYVDVAAPGYMPVDVADDVIILIYSFGI